MKINDYKLIMMNETNYVINLDNFDDFNTFIDKNISKLRYCIYRGQQDAAWQLIPSLYRLTSKFDYNTLIKLRNFQLENFRKYTQGRLKIAYHDPNDEEEHWWALGQHYGLATPLLDWVHSPFIAAYFSFINESDCEKRAIHILDINKIIDILNEYNKNNDYFELIKQVNPLTHENKRLISQQGTFTLINNYRSVEDYLTSFYNNCRVHINEDFFHLKITIPSHQRKQILEKLDLMNINSITLFPDLNGSSDYCNYLLKNEINSI